MNPFDLALLAVVKEAMAPLERKIEALTDVVAQLRGAPADPDERLPLPRAAAIAGKHQDTLRRAIKAKKLKASKPAGAREWSVRRADLNSWLDGDTKKAVDDRTMIADAVARAVGKARRAK